MIRMTEIRAKERERKETEKMTREEQKKKIFYVQMNKDFFESKNIQQLLATSAGDTIFRIYLQLWCKSLATGGTLPLEGDVPMAEELAIILGLLPLKKIALDRWQAELKVIESAVEICDKYRLIEVTENGIEFLMTDEYTRAWSADTIERQKRAEEQAAQDNNDTDQRKADIDCFLEAWKESEFPQIRKLTNKRRAALIQRIQDYGIDDCVKAVKIAGETPFMTGKNDRGWKADIEFFLRPDSIAKILEGKYGTPQKQKPQAPIVITDRMIDDAILQDGLTKANWDSKKAAYTPELQAAIEKALFK